MKKKSIKPKKVKQIVSKTSSKPRAKKDVNRKISTAKPFPIVAIGASAGGVQASSDLVRHLKPDRGMAFVFIHHLSRTYNSQLASILQRFTTMPVAQVASGMEVEPDKLYVIPPNKFMTIDDGHFVLRERLKKEINAADHFMISLAKAYKENAIGIVLSGTASDGTLGLKAIKLQGGVTFVQDESAQHQQMPASATKGGYVDYILPPERIAEELASISDHKNEVTTPEEDWPKQENEIKKILSVIFAKYDIDFFSHYKRKTINRRIVRRMSLRNVDTLEQYARLLKKDKSEVEALYNDFLINVTSFFREPDFYNELQKTVFPQLVKNRKSNDPIRIWIPGCATGEEAYSTAIAIKEFLEEKKINIPVQIFSTDLDEKAIMKARQGRFVKNILAQFHLHDFNVSLRLSMDIIK